MLRPAKARWFELLTSREDLAAILRCLAMTGQIELQSHSTVSAPNFLPALRGALDEYRRFAQRYAHYCPAASSAHNLSQREPQDIADEALRHLRSWATAADPLIARRQRLAHEQSDLEELHRMLSEPGLPLPDLGLFCCAGPILTSRLYLLDHPSCALASPPAVLIQRIQLSSRLYLLALGSSDQMTALDERLTLLKARRLQIPSGLDATQNAAFAQIAARIRQITNELQKLDARLDLLREEHSLLSALADLQFIEWVVAHVPDLALTEHFAWVTGWTSDLSGRRVDSALGRAHLKYLLRYPDAPGDLTQPVVLRNLRWVQPFEMFSRLLGAPAAGEADPSPMVALIAPVMFGFMFGDVGQGAVLVIAGVALRKRYPATALLISGGMASMVFGCLFGSVFAREDLIPALWLQPMNRPLPLLGASLGFGACVLLAGMGLDAIQHYWSGQARAWWATRAGLVLSYLGILGAVFDLRMIWAVPAGLAWCWMGEMASLPSGRLERLGTAIGESMETLLQLLVNTISFVRVGAFALAHAGLASALNGVAAAVGSRPGSTLVLLLGNLVVIAVEGLIVGIQTTRLILFEFFIRFLRGSGRPFRPLSVQTAQPPSQLARKSP